MQTDGNYESGSNSSLRAGHSLVLSLSPSVLHHNQLTSAPADLLHTTHTHTHTLVNHINKAKESIADRRLLLLASLLRELACHTDLHGVTFHPTEVTYPPISQQSWYLIQWSQRAARLSQSSWLVTNHTTNQAWCKVTTNMPCQMLLLLLPLVLRQARVCATSARMRTHAHTHAYAHTHTRTRTHAHTHTQTHTHTHV